ncbi:MAG: molybdopterin cofactor-binding domain-containing protein, partial [Chloroflexota bacterium]
RSMALKACAFEAWHAHNLPDGMQPGLEESYQYDPPNFSWPSGCHIAVVEVDTETGAAAPKRRAVRRTASPEASAAGDPAASGSDAATDAVAAPKRRATRKKAEPTA